jgi:hypothetical protein
VHLGELRVLLLIHDVESGESPDGCDVRPRPPASAVRLAE